MRCPENCSGVDIQINCPLYPDALAHVCSFWRRVAITTLSLWTHINPGLFARAKIYAARAGQLPLEIHISDPGSERERNRVSAIREGKLRPGQPEYDPSYNWEDLQGFQLLTSGMASIKTLEMDLYIYDRYREIYYAILEYFFARCKPGLLTQYTVRCINNSWVGDRPFVEPAETPHTRDGALLTVPLAHLEEVWLRLPIIRINGLCPHWKSKIYHGLTELYLDERIPELSELQLVHILRSSPKLQVLHLKTPLDGLISGEITEPVYLGDFRDLNLMIPCDDDFCSNNVLRQIAPGSKPLQLSLKYYDEILVDFFARANVTCLYIWGPTPLTALFNRSPQLEIMIIDERELATANLRSIVHASGTGNFEADDASAWSGELERVYEPVSASSTQINTLYLLGHLVFAFEEIQAVVKEYSVQRLFIHSGNLSYRTDEGRIVCTNTRNIRAKLSTISGLSAIEYYPGDHPYDYLVGDSMGPEDWVRTSLEL